MGNDDNCIPWLQTQCCNFNKSHQHCMRTFLSTHREETFNLTLRSDSLKVRHPHVFKTPIVLTRFQFAIFRIQLPSRIQTSWHFLTHRENMKLTSITSDNNFALVCRIANENLVHNSFSNKNYGWSTNLVST